jgi:hypothetical protein
MTPTEVLGLAREWYGAAPTLRYFLPEPGQRSERHDRARLAEQLMKPRDGHRDQRLVGRGELHSSQCVRCGGPNIRVPIFRDA